MKSRLSSYLLSKGGRLHLNRKGDSAVGISVPSSWIAGMQATLVLALTAGLLFDQPLTVVLALALSALLVTQDEEGAPAEYRPVTALLVLAGLLFLADYATYAWGISLFCGAIALVTLL